MNYYDYKSEPRPKGRKPRATWQQPEETRPLAELVALARAHFGGHQHIVLSTGPDGRHVVETEWLTLAP